MEIVLVAEVTVVMAQMGSTRSFSGSFIRRNVNLCGGLR
ncbi:hypothetical protein GM50_22910 [freshwater metagenome]|uniref:Uncharacterized protein n=1 Tax=freshwater metagenome TaxID=449393 RepID=A0A094PN73_9ZZZZ